MTLLLVSLAPAASFSAGFEGVLPNTPANRAHGVVGCLQKGGAITCPGAAMGMMGGMAGGSLEQQLLGNIFGLIVQGALDNMSQQASQEAMQQQQQLEQQRKALEAELARKEAERQEQERKAREAWLAERDRTYGQLKGAKPGRGLGLKMPGSGTTAVPEQWRRLYCSQYLSQKAKAAKSKDEAAFLSEQASLAMAGGQLAVQCPAPPSPPEPYGAPVLATPESPEARFYTALMKSVKGSLDELSATTERIKSLQELRQAAAATLQSRQQELAHLRESSTSLPGQEARLTEAQRQVEQAAGAEAAAARDLQKAIGRQQEIVGSLKQQEALYRQVQASPQAVNQLLPEAPR